MSQFAQTAHEAVDDLQKQIEQQEAEIVAKDALIEEQSRHIAMLEICVDRLGESADRLSAAA